MHLALRRASYLVQWVRIPKVSTALFSIVVELRQLHIDRKLLKKVRVVGLADRQYEEGAWPVRPHSAVLTFGIPAHCRLRNVQDSFPGIQIPWATHIPLSDQYHRWNPRSFGSPDGTYISDADLQHVETPLQPQSWFAGLATKAQSCVLSARARMADLDSCLIQKSLAAGVALRVVLLLQDHRIGACRLTRHTTSAGILPM